MGKAQQTKEPRASDTHCSLPWVHSSPPPQECKASCRGWNPNSGTEPSTSPQVPQCPRKDDALKHVLWAGTLTSSASLVMGYFSRLEMTSNTATMFRICKTRATHHNPALLPTPACSTSPTPRASGAGISEAPAAHLCPAATWHPALTLLSMYMATFSSVCHTTKTHDINDTRSALDQRDTLYSAI